MTCGGIKLTKVSAEVPFTEAFTDNLSSGLGEFATHAGDFSQTAKSLSLVCADKVRQHWGLVDRTARVHFESLSKEWEDLVPKISSAYKKVLALAVEHRAPTLAPAHGQQVENFDPHLAYADIPPPPPLDTRRGIPTLEESLMESCHTQKLNSHDDENELPQDFDPTESCDYVESVLDRVLSEDLNSSNLPNMTQDQLTELRLQLEAAKEWFHNYGRNGLIVRKRDLAA